MQELQAVAFLCRKCRKNIPNLGFKGSVRVKYKDNLCAKLFTALALKQKVFCDITESRWF